MSLTYTLIRIRANKTRFEKSGDTMKALKDLPFCFGLKMQAYPSSVQRNIIDKNIDFSRFYWNQLVAANKVGEVKIKRTSSTFSSSAFMASKA